MQMLRQRGFAILTQNTSLQISCRWFSVSLF